MVSEKKPSIYSDRGAIGSADELDEYGVWVKSEPQDLSSVNSEAQESAIGFALPDFDTKLEDLTSGDSGSADFGDEPIPDLDIPVDDFGDDDAESSITGFDDLEMPQDNAEDSEPPIESFQEVSIDEFMEPQESDLAAPVDAAAEQPGGENDLEAELETPLHDAPPEPQQSHDLSTQLLMKIADELSSIRTELSTLKKEFATIRSESAEPKSEDKHGFFNEEDDEKIALTGDELDNILNTADFTEEAGATEELDSAFSFTDISESAGESATTVEALPGEPLGANDPFSGEPQASDAEEEEEEEEEEGTEELIDIDFTDLGIDLDPEKLLNECDSEETAGEETAAPQAAAEISEADAEFEALDTGLDLSLADENLLDESNLVIEGLESESAGEDELSLDTGLAEIDMLDDTKDSEELKALREDGVLPMTEAPEDTSYLEEDPAALNSGEASTEISFEDDISFDSTSLDLSEAVIDEPDLSAEIVENPVEEPVLSDLLDKSDDISIDGETEDLNIDIDTEIDNMDDLTAGSAADGDEETEAELPLPEDSSGLALDSETEDNSFAQVIPEGFELDAADAPVSFDDDLDVAESALAEAGLDNIAISDDPLETGAEAEADAAKTGDKLGLSSGLKNELKTVLSYMDQLLESLPEEKIDEFAKSEYFDTYKKLFKELGLV